MKIFAFFNAPLSQSQSDKAGSEATRLVVLGSAMGASLGLFLSTLAFVSNRKILAFFLGSNQIDPHLRTLLFLGLLVGGGVAGAGLLGYLLWAGPNAHKNVKRILGILAPASILFLCPALFISSPWANQPLTYGFILTAAVLGFEQSLRHFLHSFPKELRVYLVLRLKPWNQRFATTPALLVISAAIFYSAYFSYYTILNHHRLGTAAFDMGININWCFNALKGNFWRCPVLYGKTGGHFLANHAIFAMFYWLPLFALKPGAEALLIWQAVVVGMAAIPLYKFACTQISRWSAAFVAILYIFYAPMHGPNFYDYHELMPVMFWVFTLFWALATRRDKWLWVLLPLIYSHREDVAIGIAVVGFFMMIVGYRVKLGLLIASISAGWFFAIKFIIMPRFGTWWFADIYKELQPVGAKGYGSVIQTILINPPYFFSTLLKQEKLIYFLHLFAPLAFLPLRRPALMLLAVPGFFFSLMTTGYAPTVSISFQYTCHWIPYLFAGTVLMLKVLQNTPSGTSKRIAALGAMTLGIMSHSYVFGAILQHDHFVGGFSKIEFRLTPEEEKRYVKMKELVALIPQAAAVAATENEVPHIAARLDAYTLRGEVPGVEYLLIRQGQINAKVLETQLASANYGIVNRGNGLYLFKRDFYSNETVQAKRELGISERPTIPSTEP